MEQIRPIGSERDVDPVLRVTRARDEQREREEREHEARERPKPSEPQPKPAAPAAAAPEGPVEGEDGRLHIDIKA
jgi:hypothetical protein